MTAVGGSKLLLWIKFCRARGGAEITFAQVSTEISNIARKVDTMVKLKKSPNQAAKQDQPAQSVLIKLSPEAQTNLKKLQLLSLDRQGRQPGPSQVIEKLINAAVVSGPDVPYPG